MSRITIEKVWNGYILSGSSQKEVYNTLAELISRLVDIYGITYSSEDQTILKDVSDYMTQTTTSLTPYC